MGEREIQARVLALTQGAGVMRGGVLLDGGAGASTEWNVTEKGGAVVAQGVDRMGRDGKRGRSGGAGRRQNGAWRRKGARVRDNRGAGASTKWRRGDAPG